MSTPARPMRIAIVAGEESGDLLGSDLVDGLAAALAARIDLFGVGGRHLAERGLRTLFDPAEIALMGITAVVARLPQLIHRIGTTARAIVAAKPDCLITIDSPDFSLRVASKVRAADPSIPIVHYVCPSVWAWRPQRAKRMRAYVDHVLCVLPFEPAELVRLEGPAGTYVGHRLAHDPLLSAAAEEQRGRPAPAMGDAVTLLVLPGSRRSEVKRLLGDFGATVELLRARGLDPRIVVPTVPHVQRLVEEGVAGWSRRPEIVLGAEAKYRAFAQADAALAASGTVTLELALAGVPTVSCYKAEFVAKFIYSMITVWSAALPNLIADRPIVPEFLDEFVRPGMLARHLEQLLADTPSREAQKLGFAIVAERMRTERPASELAAEAVLGVMDSRHPAVGGRK